MTSFFPDLNVWLALSDAEHTHNAQAWLWLNRMPKEIRLIFSRYTQIGMLRLLTNQTVMGGATLTLKQAWGIYEHWLADPRVEFYPEPHGIDLAFREATAPLASQAASKLVGGCYLLAYAKQCRATLVTFDFALNRLAHKSGCESIIPA